MGVSVDLLTDAEAWRARFWMKVRVAPADACWEWLATRDKYGYGKFSVIGRHRPSHRVAYGLAGRVLDPGLQIDHLCRNRACVNPAHLEAVTQLENTRRGWRATKTECAQGHPFDVANTYMTPAGRRACRTCVRAAGARLRARKREREVGRHAQELGVVSL